MAAHIRIFSENARVGLPETSLGVIPGYGGTQRLAQIAGKGRAMEMILSAEMINASKALDYGITNNVVPLEELIDSAKKMAQKIFLETSKYDKIHLFDVTLPKSQESYNESKYFMPGDKIEVIDTPIGRAGIACCYDLRFPELFRLQQEQKVDVIILPASFTEQTGKVHWETLIKARAIENLSFVVSSCQGGYHINGKKTFGHTMIVNPWGQTLDMLEKGKGFISSDIDLSQLKSIRENFPVLEHMKLISKK